MDYNTPGFPVHHQLLELFQTHVHQVSDDIQTYPLFPPSVPAFNLSQNQGLFQWVNSTHQVAKVLQFQPQHQSFQWIFRTDFLYNGLVWSPCRSRDSQESSPPPRFKSINSVLSFLYSPTLTSIHDYWKNHRALTRQTFVGKVIFLLFNMLSRLVIAFLQRNKYLLISWLQSPSAVVLEPPKIKSVTVSIASPTICHEVMELDAMTLFLWMLSYKPIRSPKLTQFYYSYISQDCRESKLQNEYVNLLTNCVAQIMSSMMLISLLCSYLFNKRC